MPGGQSVFVRVLPRLVGDDDDLLRAFGRDLTRDDRHREAAVVALPAGHRDSVVEQDLVGDVHAGGGRRADRQIAGVIVGAVTEVLEHVVALGERRFADPVRALAAHVGEAVGVAVHPLRHEVAADARIGAHALRHHGGRIVRAAGAEIRRARRHVGHRRDGALTLLQPRDAIGKLVVVAALSSTRSPTAIAMSIGSSAPFTGKSQRSCSSRLPTTTGGFGMP